MESTTIHHSRFYYQDGDIVVKSSPDAEGTATLFRVKKSGLVFHSPVFADMLTLPGGDGVHDMYDGVPVVSVSDTAGDLKALMLALYDPGAVFVRRFDANISLLLTPVVKLATKYQMDLIRQRVVDALEDEWPVTCEQWLRVEAELSVIARIHGISANHRVDGKALYERIPEPASAVRVARDFDIPSILPAAYLALAQINSDRDWSAEGDTPHFYDGDWWRDGRGARWHLLDAQDLRIVLRVRQLSTTHFSNLTAMYAGRSPEYLDDYLEDDARCAFYATICEDATRDILRQWQNDDLDSVTVLAAVECPNPLVVLENLRQSFPSWHMCAKCQQRLKDHITRFETTVWNDVVALVRA